MTISTTGSHKLCVPKDQAGLSPEEDTCDQLFSYVPLVLIFLSQFILGIGNTLYYSLGQSYLDDNTKKTNTPMMLGYAFSLRMVGPMLGFVLAYVFLNMYIDPSKTPVITPNDPRWIGAWWLGWIVLGIGMIFFAVLVGLFPRDMPKKKKPVENGGHVQYDETTKGLMGDPQMDREMILMDDAEDQAPVRTKPTMKNFPAALKRLLKNKLLMFNIFSGIFYILGSGGFMTFMSKYMEVQFNKTKADSTIVAGPLNLFGMVIGLLVSGWFISKKKPAASKLLFWNVIIGGLYMIGQFSYLFLSCSDDKMPRLQENGQFNLTQNCNFNCRCDGVPYNPVCDTVTGQTYYSACHAGCESWDAGLQQYSNCSCSMTTRTQTPDTIYDRMVDFSSTTELPTTTITSDDDGVNSRRRRSADESIAQKIKELIVQPGACGKGCQKAFLLFTIISSLINT